MSPRLILPPNTTDALATLRVALRAVLKKKGKRRRQKLWRARKAAK